MDISILKADYKSDYKIHITFSDDVEHTIDFAPFLLNSLNPMTRKYLDKKEFINFNIQYGDLIWNDYEMCFPIWDLYNGKITHYKNVPIEK